LNPSTVQFLDVDEAATDSVTVTATDGMTKSVIIDIIGDNDSLTITSDAEYSGIEDDDQITGTVVALDPEGREGIVIAYALDDSSTSGTVSINEETGAWSYQPNSNFFGTDTFIASATDDLDVTTQQTITITVSAVNDAPVLDSIGSISTQEDTTKTHTLGATDIEDLDSTLTYSAVSSKTEVSASVNGTQLILIPQLNWYGTANITVTVTDSDGGEDEEIFLLTVNSVNDDPNISNPGTQEFTEKDIHPVVLTISDVETANPAIQVSTSDNGLEATVDGSTLNLTSDGWYGDATVTVTITDDDQATDAVTFNVTVNPFNVEPPVHTVPGEQQIDTSKPYVFSIATENSIQVDDLDSEQITMTLEVQYGILKLQQTTGLEFKGGTADQTSKITIFGNLGDINAALDGMAYCSTTGYVGGDTIVLHSVDNGELVDDDTVPLTVEVVVVPGQPNLQVSTLIQPGKTMTNINVTQFDTEKIQKAEIMGEGDNLEIAIQAIGKQDGSSDHSTVDVEIFYDDGTSEIVTVPVVIYHAKLAVTQEVAGIAQLNRSTGLYEQIVEVENTTPYTMEAIRIHVEGLNENVTLQSTTGTGDDGTPYVQYDVPMTPG
jgi:VCBS repeat-containing protein